MFSFIYIYLFTLYALVNLIELKIICICSICSVPTYQQAMADHFENLMKKLKLRELDENVNLFFIQKQMGVKPSALIAAITVFCLIVTFTSNASSVVVGLVCCLLPGYFTFMSLDDFDRQDSKKYLTYWIIFAGIELITPALSFILGSFLYTILRVGLTVALLHPSFKLTVQLHDQYIQPFLKKFENQIDTQIGRNVQKGKKAIYQGKQRMISAGRQYVQSR